jgi:hypothetical protein
MATDKSKQIVGEQFSSPVSRQWIEDGYPVKFTDRQWEILVDYVSECSDEEEFDEDITYAIYNIEKIEAEYEEYDGVFKSIHGKTSREMEEGKSNGR